MRIHLWQHKRCIKAHNVVKYVLGLLSTSRTQQIVIEGVPQESVIGPLLFILYLNDLPEGIPSEVRLQADDFILYQEINTLNDYQDIQEDINTLCNWESKWQMKLNIDKCILCMLHINRIPF